MGCEEPKHRVSLWRKKRPGQFENRPLTFTARRKRRRPFEKIKIFSAQMAQSFFPVVFHSTYDRRSFNGQNCNYFLSLSLSKKHSINKFHRYIRVSIRCVRYEVSRYSEYGGLNANGEITRVLSYCRIFTTFPSLESRRECREREERGREKESEKQEEKNEENRRTRGSV